MAPTHRMTQNYPTIFLALCLALLISACATPGPRDKGTALASEQSQETLFIKGRVKQISLESETIIVKPKKGQSVTVRFHRQTPLLGFESVDEITKKQPVKIWYRVEGEDNIAVKIEKVPTVGC